MFARISRLVSMRDVRAQIGKVSKYLVIPVTLLLNAARSATDVLGSYTLAAAVDSIATSNDQPTLFKKPTTTQALLYISAACFTYSRIAPYLIRFIVAPTRREMTTNTLTDIVRKTHKLSYEDTRKYQDKLEDALHYARETSELVQLIPNNIHQPICSTIAGSIVVYLDYGSNVGTVFLLYAVIKSASGFAAYTALKAPEKIKSSNDKFAILKKKCKENLDNIQIVKAFDGEDLELKIAIPLIDDYLSDYIESVYKENLAFLSTNVMPTLGDYLVVIYILSQNNLVPFLSQLVFLLNFLAVTNTNSSRFIEACYIAMKLLTSCDEIEVVLNLTEEDHSKEYADPAWLVEALHRGPQIVFDNVSFRYNKENPNFILKNVTFEVLPSRKYALVGNSSSGKSTIIKLLLRQYRPDEGVIKINGRDINTIPSIHLYRIMSFLSQDVILFENDTIEYNVAYGFTGEERRLLDMRQDPKTRKLTRNNMPPERAYYGSAAQEALDLKEDIQMAGDAKDVPLLSVKDPAIDYERAIQGASIVDVDAKAVPIKAGELSGGQKQRVAFARSLVRGASVLLFDEPTSALDSETEAGIMETIHQNVQGKTSIMVAHRLNTVIGSDKIIVLDQGTVVQQGTHQELVSAPGRYQRFWEIQTGKVAHLMTLGGTIKSGQQQQKSSAGKAAPSTPQFTDNYFDSKRAPAN